MCSQENSAHQFHFLTKLKLELIWTTYLNKKSASPTSIYWFGGFIKEGGKICTICTQRLHVSHVSDFPSQIRVSKCKTHRSCKAIQNFGDEETCSGIQKTCNGFEMVLLCVCRGDTKALHFHVCAKANPVALWWKGGKYFSARRRNHAFIIWKVLQSVFEIRQYRICLYPYASPFSNECVRFLIVIRIRFQSVDGFGFEDVKYTSAGLGFGFVC